MICDRANILDISRRSIIFFFFFVLPFIVLVFCDSFFFEFVKNYATIEIFYSLARSPFRTFLLFYNNSIFTPLFSMTIPSRHETS